MAGHAATGSSPTSDYATTFSQPALSLDAFRRDAPCHHHSQNISAKDTASAETVAGETDQNANESTRATAGNTVVNSGTHASAVTTPSRAEEPAPTATVPFTLESFRRSGAAATRGGTRLPAPTSSSGTARRPRVQALSAESSRRVSTSQALCDAASVVKELVENALDARASRVEVNLRGPSGLTCISVSDNGAGIAEGDRVSLCRSGCTSKRAPTDVCIDAQNSSAPDHDSAAPAVALGFRGAALAAICNTARKVSVLTRPRYPAGEEQLAHAVNLVYGTDGELISQRRAARGPGTTVKVEGLFARLPVRAAHAKKNAARELARCVAVVQAHALGSPHVRFELRAEGASRVLSVPAAVASASDECASEQQETSFDITSLRRAAASILGGRITSTLADFEFSDTASPPTAPEWEKLPAMPSRRDVSYSVAGLVSRRPSGATAAAHQFLFVNRRPVDIPRLIRAAREAFRRCAGTVAGGNGTPILVLNISIAHDQVDVNLAPDKRAVAFPAEQQVVAKITQHLEQFWRSSGAELVPSAPTGIDIASALRASPDQRKSTANKRAENSVQDDDLSAGGPGQLALDSVIRKRAQLQLQESMPVMCERSSRIHVSSPMDVEAETVSTEPFLEDTTELNHKSPTRNSRPRKRSIFIDDEAGEGRIGQDEELDEIVEDSPVSTRKRPRALKLDDTDDEDCADPIEEFERHNASELHDGSSDVIRDEDLSVDHLQVDHQGETNHSAPDSLIHSLKNRRNRAGALGTNNIASSIATPVPQTVVGFTGGHSISRLKRSAHGRNRNSRLTEEVIVLEDSRPSSRRSQASDHDISVQVNWDLALAAAANHVPLEQRGNSPLCENSSGENGLMTRRHAFQHASMSKKQSEDVLLIGETESQQREAEMEMTKLFRKEWFNEMEVLGQFNLGFILCRLRNELFIVDQHASDEKHNFEDLENTTALNTQRLVRPLPLEMSAEDELIVVEHLAGFRAGGFDIAYRADRPPTRRLALLSQPVSKSTMFVTDDVQEMVATLRNSGNTNAANDVLRPARVRTMLASRACRKSVMIGMPLDHRTMVQIVRHLADLRHPWTCPHGRPTMRHLCSLNEL